MPSSPAEYSAMIIHTVKLPRSRLRSIAAKLQLLHHPSLTPPVPSRPITVVCISDTHGTQPKLPPGDVLLHAGDLSVWGTFDEIQEQLSWLASQSHAHKVVVAGNHDLMLDESFIEQHPERWKEAIQASRGVGTPGEVPVTEHPTRTRNNLDWGDIKYLRNESTTLEFMGGRTLKVYGSPDTPVHGISAFQYPRGDDVWSYKIPKDTDIVLTHGPPWGHLDGVKKSGCPFLSREVARVRPRLVVYGHIHVGYGREARLFDNVGTQHEAILGQWGGWGALFLMALGVIWDFILPRSLRRQKQPTVFVNAAVVQDLHGHKVKNEAVVLQI